MFSIKSIKTRLIKLKNWLKKSLKNKRKYYNLIKKEVMYVWKIKLQLCGELQHSA